MFLFNIYLLSYGKIERNLRECRKDGLRGGGAGQQQVSHFARGHLCGCALHIDRLAHPGGIHGADDLPVFGHEPAAGQSAEEQFHAEKAADAHRIAYRGDEQEDVSARTRATRNLQAIHKQYTSNTQVIV